jgi:predicted secreted protein
MTSGGNAISKHACPEAKAGNPTLLLARNPFTGYSNRWQLSEEEAGRIKQRDTLGQITKLMQRLQMN